MENKPTNGQRIRVKRKDAGLTQKQLADRAEIAVSTLKLYESGDREPRGSVLRRIAAALDVDANYLLGLQYEGNGKWSGTVKQGLEALELIAEENARDRKDRLNTHLNTHFDKLNEAGQVKAVERVEELTEIPRYQKEE